MGSDGNVTVALDVTVTPELRNEGMARELVNRIQNIRKQSEFEITDRVRVYLSDVPEVRESVAAYGDYIKGQVLANELILDSDLAGGTQLAIDDLMIMAKVVRE